MYATRWRPVPDAFGIEDREPRTLQEFRALAEANGPPRRIYEVDPFRVSWDGQLEWWTGRVWLRVGERFEDATP